MTDGNVVKLARRIDALNWRIAELVERIEGSDHPNAAGLVDALQTNNFDNPAWATHVIAHQLEHPEKWETGYYKHVPPNGIRRK